MDKVQAMTPIQQLEQTVEEAQQPSASKQALDQLLKEPLEISMTLPTQAYFLSGIRDFTLSLTQNLTGFSEHWAFRFQAVVDELCNNAIEHGSVLGQSIEIKFISKRGEFLEVHVRDSGTGKKKMTAKQMTDIYQDRKQVMTQQYLGFRGRGLPKIVGEWTDEVLFEDAPQGGLIVKVKKYLRKEEDKLFSSQQNDPTHLALK